MSSALASLLIGDSETEQLSLLQELERRFPLNRQASRIDPEVYDGSHRVRLRRAYEQLCDGGLRVRGMESSQSCVDWQVRLSGELDRHGNLKRPLRVSTDSERGRDDLTLGLVQSALQGAGLPVVVDRHGLVTTFLEPPSAEEARWIGLGCSHAAEGISADEADRWISACELFTDVALLKSWYHSPVDLEEATRWASGAGSAHMMFTWERSAPWRAAGMLPAQAHAWAALDRGLCQYDYAQPWLASGMTPATAAKWLKLIGRCWGNSYEQVLELRRDGLNADAAGRLHALGFTLSRTHELLRLRDSGMDVPELLEWAELDVQRLGMHQIRTWKSAGLSVADVRAWRELGRETCTLDSFNHPEIIQQWLDAGLTPDDARPWLRLDSRVVNYRLVAAWKAYGLGPSDARPWVQLSSPSRYGGEGFADPALVAEWQEVHPRCTNPTVVGQLVDAGLTPERASLALQLLAD